jgi:hypothetical protein
MMTFVSAVRTEVKERRAFWWEKKSGVGPVVVLLKAEQGLEVIDTGRILSKGEFESTF